MAIAHDEPQSARKTLSRRLLLGGLVAAGGSLALDENAFAYLGPTGRPVWQASTDALQNVAWPGQWGQTDFHVFFERTGHTLRGFMLDYWRSIGGRAVLGEPVSEPFALAGYYSQAFERAVLQYRPEYVGTHAPYVRLAPLGGMMAARFDPVAQSESRRPRGGGDRRTSTWAPLDPAGQAVAIATESGGVYFDVSGHTLSGRFLDFYRGNSGAFYLGAPISEPVMEGGVVRQYFETGTLVDDGEQVRFVKISRDLLKSLAIDTTPVAQEDLPIFDEAMFYGADNPNPHNPITVPGRKFIEVSLSEQVLYAWHGDNLISTTYVSTGLAPNYTEQGLSTIRLKVLMQDMKGFTNEDGAVVGGSEGDPGLTPYEVKDVPWVQYFNNEAEAIHGAYWHNNFGSTMSHGCVNLPVYTAKWLYGWSPLGTQMWVHQ